MTRTFGKSLSEHKIGQITFPLETATGAPSVATIKLIKKLSIFELILSSIML